MCNCPEDAEFSFLNLRKDISAGLSPNQEIHVVRWKILELVAHVTLRPLSVICQTLAKKCRGQELVLPFQVMLNVPLMMIARQFFVMSRLAVANPN